MRKWQLSESPAAKVEEAVQDRGVHTSVRDGRERLARERLCVKTG